MTCIIGIVDSNNKIYMGGDSAGISGWDLQIRSDLKIFTNNEFLIGFSSSFRMGQLLRYCFDPPIHPKNTQDMKYMISYFVPAVKDCFKIGGFLKIKEGQDSGGGFLVGYRKNLYSVDSDFQVAKLKNNITSIGCGSQVALGAMYALEHLSPKNRIKKALSITSKLNIGVYPPFIIKTL
jgi:ATP-dependent protease HslVU (ClpYQ) peptidase subunit